VIPELVVLGCPLLALTRKEGRIGFGYGGGLLRATPGGPLKGETASLRSRRESPMRDKW